MTEAMIGGHDVSQALEGKVLRTKMLRETVEDNSCSHMSHMLQHLCRFRRVTLEAIALITFARSR